MYIADDDRLERALSAGFGRRAELSPEPKNAAAGELNFGDFRIIREVGRGGMGIVYEAEQVSLGRRVALKVLPFHGLCSEAHLERFRREAQAVARLHHTNIVTVHGVGEHAGSPYLAMHFIDGLSLDRVISLLRERREATEPRPNRGSAAATPDFREAIVSSLGAGAQLHRSAALLGAQVAEGLAYAHERGVLHRDIKPSNLLLDAQGIIWIADFGLAKAEGTDGLTRSGDVVGTIGYMAPERFGGSSLPEGDIYSVGLTLYELLTLQPAFEPKSRERLMREIIEVDPPPPRRLDPSIPRDLETIVLKASSKAAPERYRTALDLAHDLRAFLEDRPISARRASRAEHLWRWCRRNPIVAALGSSVAVLLVVLAVSSSLSASRLRAEKDAVENAERSRSEELYRSYLAQARFGRLTGRAGQGFGGLDAIVAALALRGPAGPTGEQLHELRDEAIACLATPDLRVIQERRLAEDPVRGGNSFDGALERFSSVEPDGTIAVRRMRDGMIEARLPPPEGFDFDFSHARMSSDGRYLLAFYLRDAEHEDGAVVWDLHGPMKLFEHPGWGIPDLDLAGRFVALADPGGAVAILRIPDGQEIGRLAEGRWLERVRLSPSGDRMACIDSPGKHLYLFDLASSRQIAAFDQDITILTAAWSPDERWVAAGGYDPRIHVYDVESRKLRSVLVGHEGPVFHLEFHPRTDFLASSSWDNTVRLWEPLLGRQLVMWEAQTACFDGTGTRIGFTRGQVHGSLELALGGPLQVLVPRAGPVPTPWRGEPGPYAVDFSPDGVLLASAHEDGVRLWDVQEAREAAHLEIGFVESLKFHPTGKEMFTLGEYGLHRWPIAIDPGDPNLLSVGPPGVISAAGRTQSQRLAVDRSGLRLAWTDRGRQRARLADVSRSGNVQDLDDGRRVMAVDLSPDGRWAVTVAWRGEEAVVWDASSGMRVADLVWKSRDRTSGRAAPSHVSAVFSSDGRWLVAGSGSGFEVWRTGTWEQVLEIPRDPQEIGLCPLAFNQRGDLLAAARRARSVHLIQPESGRELAVLTSPDPQVIQDLCFSQDGTRIAVAARDRSVHLWDLRVLRSRLEELGLARDFPAMPPAPGASGEARPVQLQVLGAELPRRQFLDLQTRISRGKCLAWEQRLIGNPAPDIRGLEREIQRWLQQTEWTGLRDPAGLSKIPDDERAPFERIVADLGRFLEELDTGLSPPAAPANASPHDGEIVQYDPVALESTPYDFAGEKSRHGWSRWQVRAQGGGFELEPVFDVLRRRELTRLELPPGLLLSGAKYAWRVAHIGSDGQVSGWSDETSFTTGDLGLEGVRFDLSGNFNRDVVADPGDPENDEFDPGEGDHPLLTVDGFDGERADRADVRGLPQDRVVGVHILASYDRPNVVQISPQDQRPVRLEVPRRRCAALRFLVSGGWGDSKIPLVLEYTSGKREEKILIGNDWYNRLPPADRSPVSGGAVAVRAGLDHIRQGRLVQNGGGALFEAILETDPSDDLTAIIFDPSRGTFARSVTRLNLFAVTAMAVGADRHPR